MTEDKQYWKVDKTPRVYPPMPSDEELFDSPAEQAAMFAEYGEQAARTGRAMGLI